jgi:type III secretory pathway component EscV
MANHGKHMLIGGAGILAVLLVAGIPLGVALTYAVVLACPLMMFMMNRGNGGNGGGGHGDRTHTSRAGQPGPPRRSPPSVSTTSVPRCCPATRSR